MQGREQAATVTVHGLGGGRRNIAGVPRGHAPELPPGGDPADRPPRTQGRLQGGKRAAFVERLPVRVDDADIEAQVIAYQFMHLIHQRFADQPLLH